MIRGTNTLRAEQLERRELLSVNTIDTTELSRDISGFLLEFDVAIAPIDGVGNNIENPSWGATDTQLLRLTAVEYADGISEPAGVDRPSAREISNTLAAQETSDVNDRYLTDLVWLWGQFIDHDITLSESAEPEESFDIVVPTGDEHFDPGGTGEVTISLNRTIYDETAGDSETDPRQQINVITAYLDGSMVYGSDAETATSLRTFEGGRLATSEGDLLPLAESGFFEAGDIRANENVALTAMHTLWVREHNRLADQIVDSDPTLSDERIYQRARAMVIAELQAITYNEFLPALLGIDALSEYRGYDPTVNASIANIFSTASYRFGHSMLSSELLRLDAEGNVADEGNLSLVEAFFSPQEIIDHGIDSLLMGAATQRAQEVDNQVIDDVRNFLFGPPGAGGFDLASLNIQRGRDHGLADYNQARVDMGLESVTSFDQITSDSELAAALETLYGSVDNIDAWVGALAEDHLAGSSLGELNRTVIIDQFERIRAGDRFWYQNLYSGEMLAEIENTTLADVIARNTELESLHNNVFYDESVLFYAVPAGEQLERATLVVRGESLELVNDRSGEVLAAQLVSETEKVILVGGRGDQQFVIDEDVLQLDLSGGIAIDGHGGRRDEVRIRGGRGAESFVIDEDWLSVNDMAIQMSDVDELRLTVDPTEDDVVIVAKGEARVSIDQEIKQRSDDSRSRTRWESRPPKADNPPPPIDLVAGEMPVRNVDKMFAQMGRRSRR